MPSKNHKLVVVESPTKARTLTGILGSDFKTEASYGHVRDLPKGELGIDIENNFSPKYVIPRDKRKIVNALKKAFESARWIYLATDPDREGEAIAWHVNEIVKDLKNSKSKQVKRVTFHEITSEAIKKAFKNPRPIDSRLFKSQQARRILDRLVGYKLSPLLWKKIKRGLSAGRVQSVTVRLIVEREKEIKDFKPQEYWLLKAIFLNAQKAQFEAKLIKKDDKNISLKSKKGVDQVLEDLKKSFFQIAEIKTEEVKKNPPPPFMTSTLQRTASSGLGFSAKRTMRAAQNLYEEGYITYMRTDSLQLADSFLNKARGLIKKDYGEKFLTPKPKRFKSYSKLAQEAHEAIRPTDPSIKGFKGISKKVARDESLIYDLIWKRAVGCQMNPALYDRKTVDIRSNLSSGADKPSYLFRVAGKKLTFDGFLILYPKKNSTHGEEINHEEGVELPELAKNEKVEAKEFIPEQKFTDPPSRFTEGSLIKTLEEHGIGRPSTYAPIISTIQERFYVEKIEKRFHPTVIGETVNDFLLEYFPDLLDYSFTAKMEDELDEIAHGEENWTELIGDFYNPFSKKLEKVFNEAEKVEIELEKVDEKCEKCGKQMVIRVGRFGKFLACSGFPDCKNTKPLVQKTNLLCPKCGSDIVLKKTRKGKTFYGCSGYPKCDFASWRKPVLDKDLQVADKN